jgi:hypothetical protein
MKLEAANKEMYNKIRHNLESLSFEMAGFVYANALKTIEGVRFFRAEGDFQEQEQMVKVLRSFDGVGSLILDFKKT